MTDIVERLRKNSRITSYSPLVDVILEAADEIERLRAEQDEAVGALMECADDLEQELRARYGQDVHPVLRQKYERDMEPVDRARRALQEAERDEVLTRIVAITDYDGLVKHIRGTHQFGNPIDAELLLKDIGAWCGIVFTQEAEDES